LNRQRDENFGKPAPTQPLNLFNFHSLATSFSNSLIYLTEL
jgi:hypothetical protein